MAAVVEPPHVTVNQQAFFAHLNSLTEVLHHQVRNVQSFLELNHSKPADFKAIAGPAMLRLETALERFQADMRGATARLLAAPSERSGLFGCACTQPARRNSERDDLDTALKFSQQEFPDTNNSKGSTFLLPEFAPVYSGEVAQVAPPTLAAEVSLRTARVDSRADMVEVPRADILELRASVTADGKTAEDERLQEDLVKAPVAAFGGAHPRSSTFSPGTSKLGGEDSMDEASDDGESQDEDWHSALEERGGGGSHDRISRGLAAPGVDLEARFGLTPAGALKMLGHHKGGTVDFDDSDSDHIMSPGGILNPQWNGRLVWDLVVILSVLVDSMVLPFQFAFKNEADTFDMVWIYLTTVLFAFDMCLNFNTGYFSGDGDFTVPPGTLVLDRQKIAKNYLRGWFSLDLASTVPWPQMVTQIIPKSGDGGTSQVAKLSKIVKFVRFLRLIRMLRLAKLGAIWERIEMNLGMFALQLIALLRVSFVIILICHWNACIFWMVGLPRSLFTEILNDEAQEWYANEVPHWTTMRRNLGPLEPTWTWLEKDTTECYVFCFYWTLGVMRTMPAEVTPVNLPERVFVLIFMFFALSAFAICVAQITQAFFKFSERRRNFNEELSATRQHLRNVHANDVVQQKVKTYLNHIFNRRGMMAKEVFMLNILPEPHLILLHRSQVLYQMQQLERIPKLSLKCLERIADSVVRLDMFPGEVISTMNHVAKCAWITVSGRLSVVRGDSSGGFEPHTVDEGCLLTEEQVYSQCTVLVSQSAEVMRIDKAIFIAEVAKDNRSMGRLRTSLFHNSRHSLMSSGSMLELDESKGSSFQQGLVPQSPSTAALDGTTISMTGQAEGRVDLKGELQAAGGQRNLQIVSIMAATSAVTG